MTSKLVLDNIAGRTTAGSITIVGESNSTTTNLQQGLAKAWAGGADDGTSAFMWILMVVGALLVLGVLGAVFVFFFVEFEDEYEDEDE